MSEQLQPNGNPVAVGGGVSLRTPGLAGVATLHAAGSASMRSASQTTDSLEGALANEGLRTTQTVEITGAREVPAGAARVRSTSFGEPAIELQVPDPGGSWGQVVLFTDEAGVTTWHFARDDQGGLDLTRGQATRTYVIQRRIAPTPPHAASRGLVGAIGKKVLKVLAFPLIDPVMGEVGEYFAARWEKAKRPYRIRDFTADNYASPDAKTIGDGDWKALAGGRALLMVHGTTSLSHTGFGTFPRDFVAQLGQKYEGRVFAFDHYTLSADPIENVAWFVEQLPAGISLDLDIICHSRGGLVSRVFAEQQAALSLSGRSLKVNKVVFVATPNAGTILADPVHLGDLIDAYTNILNFYPGVGVVDAIEVIVTIVKQLAVGAAKGLPGLVSMTPAGPFLGKLNTGAPVASKYFALAANFEPQDAGFAFYARDILADKLFHSDNDLIVPTEGVWDTNGGGQFPIADRFVFPASDGIQHSGFFANPVAQGRILEWLSA